MTGPMRRIPLLLACATLARCLSVPPLREAPSPWALRAVTADVGDLDDLPRRPALTLRFDRAMAPPPEGALLVVTGSASDTLRADAADGSLSASASARRLDARVSLDARDPSRVRVELLRPLLPDVSLTLLLSARLTGADGSVPERPDVGPLRATAIPLRIAPARRCGALGTVLAVGLGDAPLDTARVWVRFDRAVKPRDGIAPLALRDDRGAPVRARASLDCLDDHGARCAWIDPAEPLAPSTTWRVLVDAATASNGAPAQMADDALVSRETRASERVSFSVTPVCAVDERASGRLCVRATDRWIEVRASTDREAVLRVEAGANGRAFIALGAPTTLHAVRVPVAYALTPYAMRVEAIGSDGRVHATETLTAATTTGRPRVRITEVVARPRSGSAQEYIELLNDTDAEVDLTGWSVLQGTTGASIAGRPVLAPHARGLVVGASFDPRGAASAGDPAVAPGASVWRSAGAVAGRGLRDSGANLALVDGEGRVVTTAPTGDPLRPPREGVGLVRAATDLDDDDPAAWDYDALGGCTPGAADRLR